MPPLPTPVPTFVDGFGRRVIDADGTERTYVEPELSKTEHALRDRIERLANFRHAKFARLRSVETEGKGPAAVIYVLADPVEGVRLSRLLDIASAGELVIDVNAALQVARDILPGLAVLHDSRNVTHGAIGPERVVLAPQGRCVVVDHGYGLALEKLRYPRSRLWKDFRIAMPPSAGLPQFDQRADVAQVGVLLLAMLTGRRLALNDFPHRLRPLVDEARERLLSGGLREVSASLKAWFERALPIEARRPFATAPEAQVALEEAIKRERLYAPGTASLKALHARYAEWADAHPGWAAADNDTVEERITPGHAGFGEGRRVSVSSPLVLDEEAEEIRALEATLARLAAEEAAEREAQARALVDADEQAQRQADEQARREAEEQARREAEEQARREAEEQARRREAEEQARRVAEEQARRREAEEQARREAEEQARLEAEEQARRREAEEQARRKAEEAARREAEEQARREAEEQARRREADEQARREAEEQARREADEEARREAEEQAMREADERARIDAEARQAVDAAAGDIASAPEGADFDPEHTRSRIGAAIDDIRRALRLGRHWRTTETASVTAPPIDVAGAYPHFELTAASESRDDVADVQTFELVAPFAVDVEQLDLLGDADLAVDRSVVVSDGPDASTGAQAALDFERSQAAALGVIDLDETAPAAIETSPNEWVIDAVDLGADALSGVPGFEIEAVIDTVSFEAAALEPVVPEPVAPEAAALEPVALEPVALDPTERDAESIDVSDLEFAAPDVAAAAPESGDADIAAIEPTAAVEVHGEADLPDADAAPAGEVATAAAARDVVAISAPAVRASTPVGRKRSPKMRRHRRGRKANGPQPVTAPTPSVLGTPPAAPLPVAPTAEAAPAAAPRVEPVAARASGPVPYLPAWRRGVNEPPVAIDNATGAPAHDAIAGALAGDEPSVYSGLAPEKSIAAAMDVAADPAAPVLDAAPSRGDSVGWRVSTPVATRSEEAAPRAEPDAHADAVPPASRVTDAAGPDAADTPVVVPFRQGPLTRLGNVDWKRTAAASLIVVLIEGVALATAYWYVKPSDTGYLAINTTHAGVEVLIDGRPRGMTPFTQELEPGRYTIELRGRGHRKTLAVEIAPGVATTQEVKWPRAPQVGTLRLTSSPTGARVTVDGQPRGSTPLTLEGVAAGRHQVLVESASGSVRSSVFVPDGETATLDVPIFSGWLTVYAPFEVRVFGEGRLLGTSTDGKMMLSPGPHAIELVNQRLGYREVRHVVIEPGKPRTLSVVAPQALLEVEAPEGTTVFVDGEAVGTAPVGAVAVALGTRDITLRHPALGERRTTVVVTSGPPQRISYSAIP